MTNVHNVPNQSEQNLKDIILKYLKFWPVFLLSIALGITITYLYLRYKAVPKYEVNSKILIKNVENGQSTSGIPGFDNFGLVKSAHSLEDEIGIITSNGLIEEVIINNNLNLTYYIEGQIKDVEIYGENVPITVTVDETYENLQYDVPLYVKLLDKERFEVSYEKGDTIKRIEQKYGELVELPFAKFTVALNEALFPFENDRRLYFKIGDKENLIASILSNLSVTPANDTGSLLKLSFVSNSQEKGEKVLSKIIETYIDRTIKYENELAENTIKMIDDRLKVLSGEIEDVEKTVVDFKTQQGVTDIASNADVFIQQSNQYKSRVAEYQTQISVLEQVENNIALGTADSPIGGAINDPALAALVNKYNETLLEKQRLERSANGSNPIITNYNETLEGLRESIANNVNSLKNSYSIARGNLLGNASRYDARIAKVPQMEKQLLDISRDQSTKEGLYLYLLQKREEEVLSLAAPVSSTRMVSLPKAGRWPISPNKKIMYLTGLLIGLIIPAFIFYGKEVLNTKITEVDEVTKNLQLPFIGELFNSKNTQLNFNEDRTTSPVAELFRLMRFNIDYMSSAAQNQTFMVTSTVKGEGKTFVASNLAKALASSGEKVVVLEFDLRQPMLTKNLGMEKSPGISDFIVKKGTAIEEIIQQHPTIEDLHVISSGSILFQASRFMLSNKIEILMNELKKRYQRIIIDTAPIGMISDAYALNKYVDGTIYVLRKNVSKKSYLKAIEDNHNSNKLKNTMVVLNGTSSKVGYGYGYANTK
ncbi:tyrosine-protein kinase domain-containing protein [Flavobacterium sp. ASW18X]|uniref:GumC family protein n=1 Tax=Flavobacterium sp. ASW18X TaxID=2572595 RepID=UPI0010AE25D7|nr:tyrosine-protein kinase domain-containing protein [Flavobacterium sp. ASW18X]TKD65551.1 polysaccharide biosynthesis tyrosine autokinase [Flavobacterium sp. ASW18X]